MYTFFGFSCWLALPPDHFYVPMTLNEDGRGLLALAGQLAVIRRAESRTHPRHVPTPSKKLTPWACHETTPAMPPLAVPVTHAQGLTATPHHCALRAASLVRDVSDLARGRGARHTHTPDGLKGGGAGRPGQAQVMRTSCSRAWRRGTAR